MSESGKKVVATVVLILLTVGGLVSIYQVLFDVWMTAYPYADSHLWTHRLWIRLGTTVVIGTLWTVVLIWLIRVRRRHHRMPNNA